MCDIDTHTHTHTPQDKTHTLSHAHHTHSHSHTLTHTLSHTHTLSLTTSLSRHPSTSFSIHAFLSRKTNQVEVVVGGGVKLWPGWEVGLASLPLVWVSAPRKVGPVLGHLRTRGKGGKGGKWNGEVGNGTDCA